MSQAPQDGERRRDPYGGFAVAEGGRWHDGHSETGRRLAELHPVERDPNARRTFADMAVTGDALGAMEIEPRPWHVPAMVPGRAVTLLQGDGGTGKSVIALQLCVSTALGRHWLGQTVRQGNALYLSAEDDLAEVNRRLERICEGYSVRRSDLSGFKLVDVTELEDVALAVADKQGQIAPTVRMLELRRLVMAWEPALIVVDNLADFFGGEENSRIQARAFVRLLAGLTMGPQNAGLLLLGHPSLAGMASGTGSSGSTAWNNSVRSRLYMTKPTAEDGQPVEADARLLTVKKANYGPADVEVRLRWDEGGFVAEEGSAAPLSGLRRQVADSEAETTFLHLLAAYQAQGRPPSIDPNSRTYAPTLFAKDNRSHPKRALEAAMNRLLNTGRLSIEMETSGPPSRRRKRFVIPA